MQHRRLRALREPRHRPPWPACNLEYPRNLSRRLRRSRRSFARFSRPRDGAMTLMQVMHSNRIVRLSRIARPGPRTLVALGAVLLLGSFSPSLALAGGKPGTGTAAPGPSVGARVALKEPETALWDGDRKFSSRGEI